jgi:hypothetical protein
LPLLEIRKIVDDIDLEEKVNEDFSLGHVKFELLKGKCKL